MEADAPITITGFQSPPPRRGRPAARDILVADFDFNPRPRAGGDEEMLQGTAVLWISIPAPAQGATEGTA